jgi:PIN domain nuclease of toxin-antitoxin system
MRLLLDTHAYLWWLADDPLLPKTARQAISAPRAVVHVSAASLWEISFKRALGRLEVGDAIDLVGEIDANGFVELPISATHALAAADLPTAGDDPFLSLLIAQAQTESLTLVSDRSGLADLGVDLL